MKTLDELQDELHDVVKRSRALVYALECAECSESRDDFTANIRDAALAVRDVQKSLEALKPIPARV